MMDFKNREKKVSQKSNLAFELFKGRRGIHIMV